MKPNDYAQAEIYGDRAKRKYLDEKKDKKSNDVPNLQCH